MSALTASAFGLAATGGLDYAWSSSIATGTYQAQIPKPFTTAQHFALTVRNPLIGK
jgi:hypothetical protein